MQIDALGTWYVDVAVTPPVGVDLTGATVSVAFIRRGKPTPTDWKAASWVTVAGRTYARILVGPSGTVTLTSGDWYEWVQVSSPPETAVLCAGTVTVT